MAIYGRSVVCPQCTKIYRTNNKEAIKAGKHKCYIKRREYYNTRNKNNVRRSPESFIAYLYNSIKKRAYKRIHIKENKIINRKPIVFEIDLKYINELYYKQQGRCNITNILMVHECGKLNSISIDRINSNFGYVKDNIQLLCQFINLGKHNKDNNKTIEFLNKLKNE